MSSNEAYRAVDAAAKTRAEGLIESEVASLVDRNPESTIGRIAAESDWSWRNGSLSRRGTDRTSQGSDERGRSRRDRGRCGRATPLAPES